MRRLAVPCALIAALGACGDDDDEPQTPAVSIKPNSTLRVTAKDYSFDPDRVVLSGAGRLTIRLRNAGSVAHNLKLLKGDEDVGGTPTFGGGETRSGVVNLEHGRYTMVCTVGDHAELGMEGTLQVK